MRRIRIKKTFTSSIYWKSIRVLIPTANGGWWLQVLEGSFSAVTSLFFDHIQKDKRHKNVTLLVLDPSGERQFANWDMGFYSTQAQQDSNLSWTDLDTHPAGKLIKQKLSNAQEYTSYFMK